MKHKKINKIIKEKKILVIPLKYHNKFNKFKKLKNNKKKYKMKRNKNLKNKKKVSVNKFFF
jgi:hypothetical protein